MTTPAADRPGSLKMTAEQYSAEAAQHRAGQRKRYAVAARKVIELGREKLRTIADELQDVPTDMPASEDVKQAYEAAFNHMRREQWDQAREQLLALGVAALGWAARIDVAETREAEETAA